MRQWKNSAAPVGGLLTAALLFGCLAMHPAATSGQTSKHADKLAKPAGKLIRKNGKPVEQTDRLRDLATKSTKSLEDLIKETGLPYKSVGDGQFLLAFPTSDTITTNMLVREVALAGQEKFKMITIACKVMDGTKEKKPSAALLLKIAEFDCQTDLGRIGVDKDNNVWYQSSLWKSTATGETLAYDLVFADNYRQKQVKILQSVSEEG